MLSPLSLSESKGNENSVPIQSLKDGKNFFYDKALENSEEK